MKIIIIGNSGSGKSTLAKKISNTFALTHYDLDVLFWKDEDYLKSNPHDEIKANLRTISLEENWVVEGVYSCLIDIVLDVADWLLWIELSEDECISNIIKRDITPSEPQFIRIREYYTRDIGSSLKSHENIWRCFSGKKLRVKTFLNNIEFLKTKEKSMDSKTRLFGKSLWYLLKNAIKHGKYFVPALKVMSLYNKKKVRISVAGILFLEHEQKYVLIKNHHRPELYAPIGGVYKHTGNSLEILDRIEWEADFTDYESKKADMYNDLRGVVMGNKFLDFIDWYLQGTGREDGQCVIRELREELHEGGVEETLQDKVSRMIATPYRTVVEGPRKISDTNKLYSAQFRSFDIYRINNNNSNTNEVLQEIFRRAEKNEHGLTLATQKEIMLGRTTHERIPIAGSAQYFFSSEWHGNEPTKY